MLRRVSHSRSSGSSGIPTASLAALLGAFEVLDEDLVLAPAPGIGLAGSGPRTVPCAGIDGDGRVVIALRVRGPEAVLSAIDALAWCDARGDMLARRFAADPELAPCVVLVIDEPDVATIAALATLRSADLRVFELRSVHTAGGTEHDLAEIALGRADAVICTEGPWDDRLGPEARGFVDRVREGLVRIDPEAKLASAARSIVWRRGSAALVALRARHGVLEAEVSGERFDVSAAGDVDRVLEGAVRALFAADGGSLPAVKAGAPFPAVALMPTGPLLSADELAALQGDPSPGC